MSPNVEVMIVDSNVCNEKSFTALVLSFSNLKVFKVGYYSFSFVDEVKLIGLDQLERVLIGEKCFTEVNSWATHHPNGLFHLKNCERVRELKMGRLSFSDYSVCEIDNLPSLEVIEMGDLSECYLSCNCKYASLELKGDSQRMN